MYHRQNYKFMDYEDYERSLGTYKIKASQNIKKDEDGEVVDRELNFEFADVPGDIIVDEFKKELNEKLHLVLEKETLPIYSDLEIGEADLVRTENEEIKISKIRTKAQYSMSEEDSVTVSMKERKKEIEKYHKGNGSFRSKLWKFLTFTMYRKDVRESRDREFEILEEKLEDRSFRFKDMTDS